MERTNRQGYHGTLRLSIPKEKRKHLAEFVMNELVRKVLMERRSSYFGVGEA